MLLRRSRISDRLTKEAKFRIKPLQRLGGFVRKHPILTLAGVGGTAGSYLGMKERGLYGLTPQHMRARIYGREAPVVHPTSFKPVNPLRAHALLARQIEDWSTRTRHPWG